MTRITKLNSRQGMLKLLECKQVISDTTVNIELFLYNLSEIPSFGFISKTLDS
jgi:hypothetical protein